jgi:DNA-binding response OmpR family regulator
MTRVLIIEPTAELAADIARHLAQHGMMPDVIDFADELERGGLDYDAAVLNLALDGPAVLRRLRAAGKRIPVIALTTGQKSPSARIIEALDAGADDCLVMPFLGPELAARLRAVVRRSVGLADNIVVTGRLAVDLGRQTVAVDGKPVNLSPREFGLLAALCQRQGKIVPKDQLLAQMYQLDEEPEAGLKIIDVMVCHIRKKLGPARESLATVWGRGYRLVEPAAVAIPLQVAA